MRDFISEALSAVNSTGGPIFKAETETLDIENNDTKEREGGISGESGIDIPALLLCFAVLCSVAQSGLTL